MGFLAGYSQRLPLTQDHTVWSGGSDLSNFPVLVDITDNNLKQTGSGGLLTSASGFDAVFTASDGTTLFDFEIEKYDASTGRLRAWVRIPTLTHASDTQFYLYAGNASVTTSQENISGAGKTWNSGYGAVYHLSQAGVTIPDSTANSATNGLTTNTGGNWTLVDAQVYKGLQAPGSAYYQSTPIPGLVGVSTGTNPGTIEAWIQIPTGFGSQCALFGYGYDGLNGESVQFFYDGAGPHIAVLSSTYYATWPFTADSALHHFIFSWAGPDIASVVCTIDSLLKTRALLNNGTFNLHADYASLGCRPGTATSPPPSGTIIDEARISNVARISAGDVGYASAVYNNAKNPTSFVTAGAWS